MNENRPNPRTATPEKKGSTAIGLKMNFALLALHFCLLYDVTPF